ncbi:MAG: hypothetical protein WBG36_11715 [Ornithinimicrobium sp.]
MTNYLIVANQTLGGEKLEREVTERIEGGEATFHVVVPATEVRHHSDGWGGGYEAQFTDADKSHEIAERRLAQMIDKLKSLGAEADGEVGDPSPKVAVKNVLDHASYDEVIVSTLPQGLSGWLKADVPSQVAAVTGGLVTTIEAE